MSNKAFLFVCFWPGLVFLAYGYFCLDAWIWPACWKGTAIIYLIIAPLIFLAYRHCEKLRPDA